MDSAEVASGAYSEAVLAVKLEFGTLSGGVGHGFGVSIGVVFEPFITRVGVVGTVGSVNHDPNKFLNGVVEVKARVGAGGTRGNAFVTGELKLFNQVFVRNLGETTTFISVKVDVVNIEFASKRTCT